MVTVVSTVKFSQSTYDINTNDDESRKVVLFLTEPSSTDVTIVINTERNSETGE